MIGEVTFPDTVAIDVFVAPGTRLDNATVATQSKPACSEGVPVLLVTVDDQEYREGPASLERHSRLVLRFPFTAEQTSEAPVRPPVVVDLALDGAAGARCLRLPLPEPGTDFLSRVQKLSLRMEERK